MIVRFQSSIHELFPSHTFNCTRNGASRSPTKHSQRLGGLFTSSGTFHYGASSTRFEGKEAS